MNEFMHMSEVMQVGLISVVAILVGPILAVLVTRKIDHERAERERRMDVFRTLMKTRRLRLSSEHVTALNLIEIEFYGVAAVKTARESYFENLSKKLPTDIKESDEHFAEQNRRLAKLLHAMGKALNFSNLEQLDIMTGGYTPQGWADIEQQQQILRYLLIDLLNGNRGIPISPVNPTAQGLYPPPPDEEQVAKITTTKS
jgi:hypothetical protein